MRWIYCLSAATMLLTVIECQAETPDFTGNQPQAMSLISRGRLMTGPSWWTRYGEPVNAVALAQADASPSEKQALGGPVPMHGDGYVFTPGSCDCSPPCVWDLWNGYYQNPKRCHAGHSLHRHCGCGHFGGYGRGCGKACGSSCVTAAPSGCSAPVSCTSSVPDCGCKPVCGKCRHFHVGERWRGFAAHWNCRCNSCSTPVGCGCTTPAAEAPLGLENQPSQGLPIPLPPEEAALVPLRRLK